MTKIPTLQEALGNSTLADLKGIAEARQIPCPPNLLKNDLVKLLARTLGQPAAVAAIVAALSPAEREALNALVRENGPVPAQPFTSYFGPIRRASSYMPGDAAALQKPWLHLNSATEGLWYKGLIFVMGGYAFGEYFFIPSDILPLLAGGRPVAAALEIMPAPGQLAEPVDLLHDLLTVLSFLKREVVTPVRQDSLGKRHLLSLNNQLSWQQDNLADVRSEEGTIYISFLHRLLLELKLMTNDSHRLVPTVRAADWLKQSRYRQYSDVWNLYKKRGLRDELTQTNLYVYLQPAQIIVARGRLLDAVKQCPLEAWISVSSFVKKVQSDDSYFLRSWRDGSSFLVRDDMGRVLTGQDTWERIEGYFIRQVIGTLSWLGLVSLDEKGKAFQITSLGSALLDQKDRWAEEPAARPMIVQANFEIVVPHEADLADAYRLEDLADVLKRDRASVYALTRDSVRRSLENGDTAAAIIAFLEKAGGRELPQNVDYSLREWGGKYGEVEVKRVAVLTTANEGLMRELRGSRKLKLPVQEELGPQAVGLADDNLGGLVARLKKAGYLPKVGAGLGQTAADQPYHVHLMESDLTPLVAAARLVESSGAARFFPPGLLDRLEQLMGSANQAEMRRLAVQIKQDIDDLGLPDDAPQQPAARFSTVLTLPRLAEAIRKQVTVEIEYYEDGKGEIVQGKVDPYRVERRRNLIYLIGYCYWQQAERAFLLDHVRSVTVTETGFKKAQ